MLRETDRQTEVKQERAILIRRFNRGKGQCFWFALSLAVRVCAKMSLCLLVKIYLAPCLLVCHVSLFQYVFANLVYYNSILVKQRSRSSPIYLHLLLTCCLPATCLPVNYLLITCCSPVTYLLTACNLHVALLPLRCKFETCFYQNAIPTSPASLLSYFDLVCDQNTHDWRFTWL